MTQDTAAPVRLTTAQLDTALGLYAEYKATEFKDATTADLAWSRFWYFVYGIATTLDVRPADIIHDVKASREF